MSRALRAKKQPVSYEEVSDVEDSSQEPPQKPQQQRGGILKFTTAASGKENAAPTAVKKAAIKPVRKADRCVAC